MPSNYPESAAIVVATVREIFDHQGKAKFAEVLNQSRARFEETGTDDWDREVTLWTLHLEIPTALFATIEDQLEKLEKGILSKLAYINRRHPGDRITQVAFSPLAAGERSSPALLEPAGKDLSRIWKAAEFRLFLSHVSKHREAVMKLKGALSTYGIGAFVAHDDIKITEKWRDEIERALQSADALAALLTPEFHESEWTDQEVGWALGRGILVIPIQLGAVPYGLAGKFQGARGQFEYPDAIAAKIVGALLGNDSTRAAVKHALVKSFCTSRSVVEIQILTKTITPISDFSDGEKSALLQACEQNPYVAKAYYVPGKIAKAFRPEKAVEVPEEDVPF